MRSWLLISGLAFLTACATPESSTTMTAQQCISVDDALVAAQFERWNQTLQSGDPAQVVKRYAPGSLLLPTLSSNPRISESEKHDYFVHFLERSPRGQIIQRVIVLGCNQAIDSGLYDFKFADGTQAHARYTFSYNWDGQDWLISSHHSSLLPPAP